MLTMEGAIDSMEATSRSVAEAHVRSHWPSVLCMGRGGCLASASSDTPSTRMWHVPSTTLQQSLLSLLVRSQIVRVPSPCYGKLFMRDNRREKFTDTDPHLASFTGNASEP